MALDRDFKTLFSDVKVTTKPVSLTEAAKFLPKFTKPISLTEVAKILPKFALYAPTFDSDYS